MLQRVSVAISFIAFYAAMLLFISYTTACIYLHVPSVSWLPVHVSFVVCVAFSVLWIISIFNDMFFVTEGGRIVPGALGRLGQSGGYIVTVFVVLIIVCHIKKMGIRDSLILLSFVFFPVLIAVVRFFYPEFSQLGLGIALSILMMYICFHIEQTHHIHNQSLVIAENRNLLMLSQIKPHFVFNVLNSIYVLCEKDSREAQRALGEFSEYLRTNLDSLKDDSLVSFRSELEHVAHYVELEKIRFGDGLNFVYDIQTEGFKLPLLTLQPLVENAVKHGITKKPGGGTVRISTHRTDSEFVLSVKDDGVGFDMGKLPQLDASKCTGIGLVNVRERLASMIHAAMEIYSEPGHGTEVVIRGRLQGESS